MLGKGKAKSIITLQGVVSATFVDKIFRELFAIAIAIAPILKAAENAPSQMM